MPRTQSPSIETAPPADSAVASTAVRHLLSRFSYGLTPELVAEALLADSANSESTGLGWFERQLDPETIEDSEAAAAAEWWPFLWWSPQRLYAEDQRQGGLKAVTIMADFQRWTLMRRILSRRQLHEAMTEMWSNHFHVPAPMVKSFPVRVTYDATIRAGALGRFDDLLVAAVLHPAMLTYLDNSRSTKKIPNENLGRELLELHTVGHAAGITQADVDSSTRILTGWRVDTNETWEGYYSERDHYVGPVEAMGFADPNESPDGRDVTIRYLRYLAHHPATARRIAGLLARRFISDSPTNELISAIAAAFLAAGTDIKKTLRFLIGHPDFQKSIGLKVRTPTEDLVNTYRVLQVRVAPPRRGTDAAKRILQSSATMGQKPFDWPAPNGFPDAADAWTSASRILCSWQVHRQLATGHRPQSGVEFRTVKDWLPELPCRFDALVEHVTRLVLAQPSNTRLQQTASIATGVAARETVTADSDLVQIGFDQLLLALLDSPEHMTR